MMNSNLNLSALPECKFAYQMVNSALLIPCAEYQRVLHVEKVAHIAENFSEYGCKRTEGQLPGRALLHL